MISDFIKLFKMYALFTLSILMKLIILNPRLWGCPTSDSLVFIGGGRPLKPHMKETKATYSTGSHSP